MSHQTSEGQRNYRNSSYQHPSRLGTLALSLLGGLAACSGDSQKTYFFAQQKDPNTILVVYDRWDSVPGPGQFFQPASYDFLRQEYSDTQDRRRKESICSAKLFLEKYTESQRKQIKLTGTARDHELAATVLQREICPHEIVFCFPLGNYTISAVQKIREGYAHACGKKPIVLSFDGKNLEEIVQ